MKITIRLVFLFIFLFTTITCSNQLFARETGMPLIRNYPPKEYRGGSQIWSILQDKRGVLYFASDDLMEYDGVSWREIPTSYNSTVRDLFGC
jgi:hypothetical protein